MFYTDCGESDDLRWYGVGVEMFGRSCEAEVQRIVGEEASWFVFEKRVRIDWQGLTISVSICNWSFVLWLFGKASDRAE